MAEVLNADEEVDHMKKKEWIWVISLMCCVLGMLLAASLKTQQYVRQSMGLRTTEGSSVIRELYGEKETNKTLRKRIDSLVAEVDKAQKALGQGGNNALLSKELDRAKFVAGLTPAVGEGLEITVQDSPKQPPRDLDPVLVAEYIVHDIDLRNLVNELIANGAEAVSVSDADSDQRIIANTAIRCVGGPIMINNVKMGAPFTIKAIGPTNTLYSGLKMHNGILDQFRIQRELTPGMVVIKKRDEVHVPAYTGSGSFVYAHEEKAGGEH